MSILLTGGTGKTATRLARLLHAAEKRVLVAYRKTPVPEPFTGVYFDWNDPTTFENPFSVDSNIKSVYLVDAPGRTPDLANPMEPFIDLAMKKGVTRFVLLSASPLEAGGPAMGQTHAYLLKLDVDFCVLRPSWFFENFLTNHGYNLKNKDTMVTASEDGKIGFVSADDIAATAFDALTREASFNTYLILTGPELLSYDDVAKIFSEVLGRAITHTRVSVEDMRKMYMSYGLSEDYAGMVADMETTNATGVEEKMFFSPKKVGLMKTLKSFVEENKEAWNRREV